MNPLKVAIIHQDEGGGATAAAREIEVWAATRCVETRWYPHDTARSGNDLLNDLGEFAPDLLHLHCWYQSYDHALLPDLTRRYPTLMTVHDVYMVNQYDHDCWECYRNAWCFGCPQLEWTRRYRPNYRILDRWRKRGVNSRAGFHLAYPSQWMRWRLQRTELASFPGRVMPYSVDTDLFIPEGPREEVAGVQPDDPVALFAGNMYSQQDHRKGLTVLLDAWPDVRAQHPAAHLLIAGNVVLERDLPDGVTVLGQVSRERSLQLLRRSQVFVLPSLGDNSPLATLEAMSVGVPVVATRVGGIPEQVINPVGDIGSDQPAGTLVEPRDAKALGRAIAELLADPDGRQRMGAAGRRRVLAGWSREVSSRAHRAFYDEVVSHPATR